LVVLSVVCGFTAAALNGWYDERDFHCFWVAGQIVANGGDPYDPEQYVPAILTIPPSSERALERCGQRLAYPPWTGMTLAPLGVIPLQTAATIWASLAVLAAVLGINWTWQLAGLRRFSWPLVALLVVATEPFARNFSEGQFATFGFALTAGASLSLLSHRDGIGGVSTAALSIKPHTAIGFGAAVLVFAILQRRWLFVAASGATALGLIGLSQLVRPGWIFEFVDRANELSGSIQDRATIWNLAGSSTLASVVILLLVAAVVVLIRPRGADDAEILGLAVSFSLVVAPYAWDHDYVVLAIPWAIIISRAQRLRPLLRDLLTLSTVAVAAPLGWILSAVAAQRGSESLFVLVPTVTALLLAVAIRWGAPRVGASQT
jgi:hypothetical protein